MKKKVGELLFQIIPVMIGVYLGFLVSNWSEDNQKKKQSQILIDNLISEISTNEERLSNVIDYHVMLRDSSRFYSDPAHAFDKPEFFRGTQVVKLTNSAFLTGIQTGMINELPIDQIQSINQLYTFQNDYNEFSNLLMSNLLSKDFSENEEDMRKIARFLSISMTDIVIKETDLINRYSSIKEQLNE